MEEAERRAKGGREGGEMGEHEAADYIREQNFPQLGITLSVSRKACEQVMMFIPRARRQVFWHLCHFIPRGGNGKLCSYQVCVANGTTFASS